MATMRHNDKPPTANDKKQQQQNPEVRAVFRDEIVVAVEGGVEVNAAGHRDQLKRQYNLWALTGVALTVDNAWAALGSSITISIARRRLSLGHHRRRARFGRVTGFFAGWINFYGWIFGLASLLQVTANIAVQMYATYHRATYAPAAWHVYAAYVLVLWLGTACVVFANRRVVPYTQHAGMLLVIVGGIVTITVVAAMPKRHASNTFVWGSFAENNLTGWPGGVAFLLGVLNGAFTIGTPDAITHLAEELPHPRRDLPKVIGLQIGLGGLYAFVFAITLGYAITDLSALAGGTLALLLILLLSTACCNVGTLLTCSRTYWALARDGAVPLAGLFARVDEARSCPMTATLLVSGLATGLGAVALGSGAAFLDLSGSFIILTTVSYAVPLVANMATGRRYFPAGPFHMGRGWFGWVVNGLAVLFIVLFDVLFCFPFAIPTTTETMNYNSVILAPR
ncbi:choline transport protein [Apiospora phragmitis]|uniref:Choline transport protein n=1 Tax=Apiospora phragmitis TaxID=2905665 RepID=A0ABR1UUK1_9PEZI